MTAAQGTGAERLAGQTAPIGNLRIDDLFFHLFFLAAIAPLHNVGVSIEHMPYGIACIAFARNIRTEVIVMTLLLLSGFVATMLWYGEFNTRVIAYYVGTLNIMSFLWFIPGNERRLLRAARNVFWLSMGVGALQYVGAFAPLEPVMKLLIERFHGTQVGDFAGGYRGVTMLETEPARASIKIILLYIIAFHSDRRPLSIYFMIAVFAQLVMIKSTTGVFLSMLAIFAVSMRYTRTQIALGVGVLLLGPFVLDFLQANPKFAVILALYEREGLVGLYNGLAATSGGRVLAIVSTAQSILTSPLGHGADPEFFSLVRREELERLVSGYKTYLNSRPPAMFLNFLYAYGWIPFVLLIAMTLRTARRLRRPAGLDPVFWLLMFCGFFYSSPASPLVLAAWVLYAYRTAEAEASADDTQPAAPAPAPVPATGRGAQPLTLAPGA